MNRKSLNEGKIAWSGESFVLQLQDNRERAFSAYALVHRVALSPFGRGTSGLVLADPDRPSGWPETANFVITDNQRLTRWLIDDFASSIPEIQRCAGFGGMSWHHLTSCDVQPLFPESPFRVCLWSSDLSVNLTWNDLCDPIPVEANAANSATGTHDMYAVILEANSGELIVNGVRAQGEVSKRKAFGRDLSGACLSLSETWVSLLPRTG